MRLVASLLSAALLAAAPSLDATQEKASARSSGKPAAAAVVVNINTAPATELQTLPGIGAKTAARIVEYRQKNGPFKKIEELMNVQGIGEKNFLKLKAQISTAGSKPEGAAR